MLTYLVLALGVGGGICAHRAGLLVGLLSAAQHGGFSKLDDQDQDEEAPPQPPSGKPPGLPPTSVPPTAPPLVKKPSLPLVQIKRARSFSKSEGGSGDGGSGEGAGGEGGSGEGGSGEGGSAAQSVASTTQAEAPGEPERERLELHQWWTASPAETPPAQRPPEEQQVTLTP